MGRFHKNTVLKFLRSFLLISILVAWQIAFAAAPLLRSQVAHAVTPPAGCVNDTAGANDEPGQKDLTQLCTLSSNSTAVHITWNWDELGTTGQNTMDGCALFDTNGDGNINYSVCVTTTGSPATLQSTTIYSCGDDKIDRCTSPVAALVGPYATTCSLFAATDPFPTGADSPKDTGADCNLVFADVGGSAAQLVDVCSYPSQQPNSDPSDCVIIQPKAGKLEVKKHLIPSTDSGLFNLQINSVTKAANVGDGGTTGEVIEPSGNNGTSYTVGEIAGTNTALSNYNSSIECRDQNGTGDVVASGSTTSTSVTVTDGADIVCVITNTLKQSTLILQKTVSNTHGGTLTASNFPVAIGANAAQWGSNTVSPGTYTVSETQQTGYQAGSWGTDCTAGGSVTLAPGQTKTCSITNSDIAPQLTVIKHVVNDNGGTATASSFTMNVTGANVSNASFAGAESPGTTVTLNAGSYSVDEGAFIGYSKSLSTDCSGTIAIGQTKTCTITNDDIAPNLTVTKVVVNPYGTPLDPSAFPLFVDSISVTSGVSTNQFNAGSHTVTETQQTGYTLTGVSGDCSQTNNTISLTLSVGGTSTCTLTNTAIQPKILVIKHVVNDNGGTKTAADFTMTVTGNSATVPNFTGAESPGTNVNLNEGNYTVDEVSHTGYAETMSGDCNSTIAIGQTKTCTITNNDIAPSLTLNKIVSNSHGGTAVESNWTLTASGPSTLSGLGATGTADVVSDSTFKAGTYILSEAGGPTGYSASDWTCTNGVTVTNAHITLANGQTTVCSITNSDVAPNLTVTKVVVNPYGTALDPSAFPLFVDGISVTSGVSTTQFNAGSHTVTETQHTGYTLTGVSGNCTQNQQGTIGLTLTVGGTATCTLTNTAIQPQLTVIKHVINDNSGTSSASDFTMTVTGNSATVPNFTGAESPGTMVGLNEGNYSVDEVSHVGYTETKSADCTGTISIGQTKTCTITNNDIAHPAIHIVKSGPATAHEGDTVTYTFMVTNIGDTNLSGVTVNDDIAGAGTYQSGDTNNDNILQKTETWIYTKDYVIPADQTEDVVNTAEACSYYIETKVCDTDEHTLDVLHPSIHVDKFGPATAFEGDTVTYTFLVTNTGDTELTDVGIADDIATGETCLANTLAPSISTTCTATYTIPTPQVADVTNHVIASGTDSLDETVTDTDQHTLDVLHPSIHVVKSGPTSAPAGTTVIYTFTVTNTGDVPLSGLTVQDNIAGAGTYQSGDTNNDGILETSETWIYTAQYSIPSNQFNSVVNTVTVCGLFGEQLSNERLDTIQSQSVCDQDEHTLVIPKVLAEVTPPQLVNTGQPIMASIIAGSAILFGLLLATGLSRKTNS